jgi:hypothetical protein
MHNFLRITIVLLVLGVAAAVAGGSMREQQPADSIVSVFAIENHELRPVSLIANARGLVRIEALLKEDPGIRADFIFDLSSSTVLFGREQRSDLPSLWTFDRESGSIHAIYTGVSMALLSPDGSQVIVTTGKNEIHLLTRDGVDLGRIGVHGGSAVFSPDGRYVAYMKLADKPSDLQLGGPRRVVGIAVYDIALRREKVVLTARNNEYGVASWSPDGSRIYYLAEKELAAGSYRTAMYSIRSTGGEERIELDPAESSAPPFNSRTLWFPNSRIAVSEGDGVWYYLLNSDSHVVNAVRLSDGNSLQIFQPDESFAYATKRGHSDWTVIDVETLQGVP